MAVFIDAFHSNGVRCSSMQLLLLLFFIGDYRFVVTVILLMGNKHQLNATT